MLRLFVIALLFWLTSSSTANGWLMLKRGGLALKYQGDPNTYAARRLADSLPVIEKDLQTKLGFSEPLSVTTYVYFDRAHFNEENQSGPNTILGKFHASDTGGIIRLDGTERFEDSHKILYHELTHAAIATMMGRKVHLVPIWLNEGVATYYSEPEQHQYYHITHNAALQGGLLKLAEISDRFPGDSRAQIAYSQSWQLVKTLEARFGKGTPGRILSALRNSPDFPTAFQTTTGGDLTSFEASFIQEMNRESFDQFLVRNLEWMLWGSFTIAFIITLTVMRLRRRQKLRRIMADDPYFGPGE